MKLLLIIFIAVATLASLPKVQADPYTGYYKIAIVITGEETYQNELYSYQDGEIGRIQVYLNASNKLRIKGYLDTGYEGRLSLRGKVNKSTGEIVLTSIGGESVEGVFTVLKILKRNKTVVGVKGSGTDIGSDEEGSWDDVFEVVGYKTRNLPQ